MKSNHAGAEGAEEPCEQVGMREAHIVLKGLQRWLAKGERERVGVAHDDGELSAFRLLVERAEEAADGGAWSDSKQIRSFSVDRFRGTVVNLGRKASRAARSKPVAHGGSRGFGEDEVPKV